MSKEHDEFVTRVITAIMGGIEILEAGAKRGSFPCDRDLELLLQASVRLKIVCHDYHNNRRGISREEHNRKLILPQ